MNQQINSKTPCMRIHLNNHKQIMISHKREQLVKDIRQKNREQMRATIRQSMLAKINSVQQTLISTVLECFSNCTHWQLFQQQQKLCEVIESTPLTQLEDDQHQQFVTDLYYLIHENIITMPYGVTFKKNESDYTAALVALAANQIEEHELAYWIKYMNDEAKDVMLYGITVEDQNHEKWVTNTTLYEFILQNTKWIESAAITFKDLLVSSEYMTKKHVDKCLPFIESALKFHMEKQNLSFRRQLTQIWIKIIIIYSKFQEHKEKVKQMIFMLKQIINANLNVLLRGGIIQDLNQLYQTIRDDYIEDNLGCQQLLMNFIQERQQMMRNQEDFFMQDEELFKNYLFRLFHNNWRAKQLKNRNFAYSSYFYEQLDQLNKGKDNPLYQKLKSIQSKKRQ